MKTTVKDLKKVLENALLNDGKMEYDLYEYEYDLNPAIPKNQTAIPAFLCSNFIF